MMNRLLVGLLLLLLGFANSQAQTAESKVHGQNFRLDCALCHTTQSWQVDQSQVKFDHSTTGFSLLGAHGSVKCQDCHTSLIFSKVSNACIDCHTDIHQGEMGIRCERCHSPRSWENRLEVFELHQQTRFPLLGVHAVIDCQSCHSTEAKNEFKLKSVECKECHLQNFLQTLNPQHQKARFNLDCQQCHLANAANWQQAVYEHSARFPLSGGHSGLECNDCHSNRFQGISVDCYSCHQDQYNSTTNPNHQVFGFPTVCEECHMTTQWKRSQFDHQAVSGFALIGAHANSDIVQCVDCHVNNQLTGLPKDCYGCHQKNYQTVSDPNHVQGNFPHDCLFCHNQQAWSPADFDHDRTNFPLTGAHQTLECSSCHQNGVYAGTPTDCYSCHQSNYEQTSNPDHAQLSFNHDCTQCHSTNAWTPATFDHNQTNFPLTGAHKNVDCASCHKNGVYAGTPTDCYSCHQSNFEQTTDPNHVQNNFSHDCTQCHSTNAWSPATFDHNQTNFPLTGAHKNVNCTSCHQNGYTNTPTECVACHQSNYDQTTNPDHQAANFPVTCQDCHSTNAWSPANWDHDSQYFPIYSGKHKGEWSTCADCHVNSADYSQFECINCHEHNRTKMDDKHRGVANYVYQSQACYNCHPTGGGGGDD